MLLHASRFMYFLPSITLQFEIAGSESWTLQEFLSAASSHLGVSSPPNMVVQGTKMVYVKAMPTHKNRLAKMWVLIRSLHALSGCWNGGNGRGPTTISKPGVKWGVEEMFPS